MKTSIESIYRIWDDDHGEIVVEVKDDGDGLGLIEIQQSNARITIPPTAALALAQAITKKVSDIKAQ